MASYEEDLKSSLEQAKSLEGQTSELRRQSDLLGSNATFDRGLAERLKGELGIKTSDQRIAEGEATLGGGKKYDQAKRNHLLMNYGRQTDAELGGAIARRLSDLTKQQQDLRAKALGSYKGMFGEREKAALGQLEGQAIEADKAIQDQLSMQLEDAGLTGDMARQQAGALMAGRGMLRSTQTEDKPPAQSSMPSVDLRVPLCMCLLGFLLAETWFSLCACGAHLKSLRQRCADWLEG